MNKFIALVGMTARVSIGKKNMVEPDEYYQDIDRQAARHLE